MSTLAASEDGFGPSSEDRSARWPKAIFRVLKGKQLLPFAEDIDVERIHVKEPFDVVLLCGGPYDLNTETLNSLRDAFLKALPQPKPLKYLELIQAEDITKKFGFSKNYDDLLMFETDLAQIVKLIILFCESEGTLAELGAFSVIGEITNRLFVVIREQHWNEDSFIKLGPLQSIIRQVGRNAIHVIADDEIGYNGNSPRNIDKSKLVETLEKPLEQRLSIVCEPTTFDRSRSGHIIKLIVGLIQEYGALTKEEISWVLKLLNVEKNDAEIRAYLHCAESIDWLSTISRGANDYYVLTKRISAKGGDAAVLHMKQGSRQTNKPRRRTEIMEYWKEKDIVRFSIIQKSRKEA